MKLKFQGYALIAVPLAVQICLTYSLLSTVTDLDRTISRENKAKQILARSDSLKNAVAETVMIFGILRVSIREPALKAYEKVYAASSQQIDELLQLSAEDPKGSEAVTQYVDSIRHYFDLMTDSMKAYSSGGGRPTFANVVKEEELLVELTITEHQVSKASRRIQAIYGPEVSDAQPEAAKKRQDLRFLISFGIFADVILSLVLGTIFGALTLRRLSTLMKNIDCFFEGRKDLAAIGGSDEIAEIDSKFRSLAELRWQAEQEKAAVLQTVAHDLRGPLTSINLMVSNLLELHSSGLQPKVERSVKRIQSETSRLKLLCDDFLEIERMESGNIKLEMVRQSVEPLLMRSLDSLGGLAEEKHITLTASGGETLEVFCDGERIIQVLVNLVSNAIKFSPSESTVEVSAHANDEHVTFSVRDHGPGISEAARAKLFQRFSTGTSAGGVGLGLWICSRIVALHNGRIGVESSEGQGSRFWLEIPNTQRRHGLPDEKTRAQLK